jgi:hypothetical protein
LQKRFYSTDSRRATPCASSASFRENLKTRDA